ncbi:MAG: YcaO-like family protein [Deltaproteobacteria bacterium]|nr:YcaO-like family protein [Deltaproteobacteria bacterium]
MEFQNCVRNAFGKCDLPACTVRRIKDGFKRLGLHPEYASFRVSDNIYWGRVWIDAIRIVCVGKGVTPELAEASAYAELAERFSAGLFYPVFEEQVRYNVPALYDGPTRRFLHGEWMNGYVRAHQDDLDNALTLEALLENERHLNPEDIKDIKNSRMAQHWVDGFSILQDRMLKVPVNFVTYIHASNGLAAGNTLEEALIQASCEIFERHAQIHTIKPERVVPSVDPASIAHPVIENMIAFYRKNRVSVVIKHLCPEGVLPVLGVLFINKNLPADRLEYRILIAGASFHSDEAITRCFTEGMQGRKSLESPRPELDRPVVPASRVDNYYLLMKCGICPKDIGFLEQGEQISYQATTCPDVLSEIEAIRAICKKLDTDCILLDLTHPVLDFPVVRVIMPGVSDFLPFLRPDILVSKATRPSAVWRGEEFIGVMESFFS